MKHVLFFFLQVLLIGSLYAQSVRIDTIRSAATGDSAFVYSRPNLLKTNLLGLFSLFYERQVQPRQSLQIGVNQISFSLFGDFKYFGLSAAYKFYLSKLESTPQRPYPSGFYVSPYLRYANVHETNEGFFSSTKHWEMAYSLFGGGAVAGYQLIFRKGFVLDFYLGGGYLPAGSSRLVYLSDPAYKPEDNVNDYRADVRLGLCLGYAFK